MSGNERGFGTAVAYDLAGVVERVERPPRRLAVGSGALAVETHVQQPLSTRAALLSLQEIGNLDKKRTSHLKM